MASGPIQACCVQGFKHEGTPAGTTLKLLEDEHGVVEAYLAKAAGEPKAGIVFVPDVIGYNSINAQLLADQFATKGYNVLVPDPFYGDAIALNQMGTLDLQKWLAGGYNAKNTPHTAATVDPIVAASIRKLREEFGLQKVGGIGYCFGAKYVVRFLKESGFDAGYGAHPSFVADEELSAITRPLSIAAAEVDHIFTQENRVRSEGILAKVGVPWQISLYGGVSHGFAVRGDMKDPKQRFAIEAAFEQARLWFEAHL